MRLTSLSVGCGEKIDDVKVLGLHNWVQGSAPLRQQALWKGREAFRFRGTGCIQLEMSKNSVG